MENIGLVAGDKDKGKRLDQFMAENLREGYSRSYLQKLIRGGCVLLNNEKVIKSRTSVEPGDNIKIAVPPPKDVELVAEKIPLEIVFEDDHLLVINKPVGMVVHPGAGNRTGTMVNALMAHCGKLSCIGGELRPGIVHRLDKDTSGLLVVAKDDRTHRGLSDQFKERETKRKYIAFVRGIVQLDNGTIDLPIARHKKDRQKMAVGFSEAKEAITHYKVLTRFSNYTMLELRLSTGRTHQIRAHMEYLGHPLLGDKKYGRPSDRIKRQALHAKTLGFRHPITNKILEFDSELPADMQKLREV